MEMNVAYSGKVGHVLRQLANDADFMGARVEVLEAKLRLVKMLLDDPHPGLHTWQEALSDALIVEESV